MSLKPIVCSILLFLTLQVNCDTLPKVQYTVTDGESLTHKLNYVGDVLEKCQVYTNNYGSYDLLADKKYDNIEGVDKSKDPNVCQVKILKTTGKNAGEWELTATFKSNANNETKKMNQYFQISIEVEKKIKALKQIVTTRKNVQTQYSFDYDIFDTTLMCNLKLSNGTVYELMPTPNVTDPRISPGGYSCSFKFKNITVDDIGRWEVHVDTQEFMGKYYRSMQPIDVVIEEKIAPNPSESIEVYEGQNIELSLSEAVPNFAKCDIVSPQKVIVVNNEFCNYTHKNIDPQMSGTWLINGTGDIKLYSTVKVTVKAKPVEIIPINVYRGASAELIFGPEKSLYCKAKNSNGNIVVENEGQCKLLVDKVTSDHGGDWDVEIGLPESMETVLYKYNIMIKDIGELHDKKVVPYFEIREHSLIVTCKFLINKMKSCYMTRSDGKIFMVNDGIGYENYKHILNNNINNDSDYVECGIEVFEPMMVDIESWKCTAVSEEDGESLGSYIMPNNPISDKLTPQISTLKVVIGKSYDMICDYPSTISYCWFYSPNKTMYSILSDTSNDQYEYNGQGLQFGQCRMRVKSASASDQGSWKCNVGVDKLKDQTATIKVDVHRSSIKTGSSLYTWYDNLSVTCNTVNQIRLKYCRYVRPDGLGINPTNSSYGYTNEGTDLEVGKCSMKFTEYVYENVGIWRCIAKPYTEDEEYVDVFQVYTYSSSMTSTNFLVWSVFGVFAMTLVAMLTLMICRLHILWSLGDRWNARRSTRVEPSIPPPYNADIFTQSETKTDLA